MALRHIMEDFKLQKFVLECSLFDAESQTTNNIRAFVDLQLSSFGLVLNNTIFVLSVTMITKCELHLENNVLVQDVLFTS